MAKIGDLKTYGKPKAYERLLRVIARDFHRVMADVGVTASRGECVASSVVLREYLRSMGVLARTISVHFGVFGVEADGTLRSVEAGAPEQASLPLTDSWPGHMAVLVPGFIIDLTLYQFRRPWHAFPDMAVVPLLQSCPSSPANEQVIAKVRHMDALGVWAWHEDRPDRRLVEDLLDRRRIYTAVVGLLKATGVDVGDAPARIAEIDRMQPGERVVVEFPKLGVRWRIIASEPPTIERRLLA